MRLSKEEQCVGIEEPQHPINLSLRMMTSCLRLENLLHQFLHRDALQRIANLETLEFDVG